MSDLTAKMLQIGFLKSKTTLL